eukprot:364481-Chlamydomonas_euryale.AAC.11
MASLCYKYATVVCAASCMTWHSFRLANANVFPSRTTQCQGKQRPHCNGGPLNGQQQQLRRQPRKPHRRAATARVTSELEMHVYGCQQSGSMCVLTSAGNSLKLALAQRRLECRKATHAATGHVPMYMHAAPCLHPPHVCMRPHACGFMHSACVCMRSHVPTCGHMPASPTSVHTAPRLRLHAFPMRVHVCPCAYMQLHACIPNACACGPTLAAPCIPHACACVPMCMHAAPCLHPPRVCMGPHNCGSMLV